MLEGGKSYLRLSKEEEMGWGRKWGRKGFL